MRKSDEVRPGSRAKRSDNQKFLRLVSDENKKMGEDRRGNCLVCLMLGMGLVLMIVSPNDIQTISMIQTVAI